MSQPASITQLATPCLLLDSDRLDRNIARMRARATELKVTLRPHLKTAKSIDVMHRLFGNEAHGPVTVSTLAEAECLAEAGARDILYAVGIAPNKLDRVLRLRATGVDLTVILDSIEAAQAVAAASREAGDAIPTLVEINTDGKRSGVLPDDAARLRAIAEALSYGARLKGVMTHAGASYGARTPEALVAFAAKERDGAVEAASILRAAGHAVPVVSVGSTPTALFAVHLDGVTELRAGVYMFMDLVMLGIGVCDVDDLAVSVLSTVIGVQPETGRILCDAGWTAMSRDRGTASQPVDQGFGLVCDKDGRPYADAILAETNQEHGIIAAHGGGPADCDLRIGDMVRILPNHACATAGQHAGYILLDSAGNPYAHWPRFRGW